MMHKASNGIGLHAGSPVSVVVDTSAILCCVADGKDVIEAIEEAICNEVEVLIPENVADELKTLAKRRGRRGELARAAINLLKRYIDEGRVKLVRGGEGDTDTIILELSSETRSYVATADARMAARARVLGAPTLIYRKAKKRFELS